MKNYPINFLEVTTPPTKPQSKQVCKATGNLFIYTEVLHKLPNNVSICSLWPYAYAQIGPIQLWGEGGGLGVGSSSNSPGVNKEQEHVQSGRKEKKKSRTPGEFGEGMTKKHHDHSAHQFAHAISTISWPTPSQLPCSALTEEIREPRRGPGESFGTGVTDRYGPPLPNIANTNPHSGSPPARSSSPSILGLKAHILLASSSGPWFRPSAVCQNGWKKREK